MLETQATTSASRTEIHSLDSLSRRSLAELDALYRIGRVPTTMHSVDGALRGRMLAVRGISGPIGGWLRSWAASPSFMWEGKTFEASSDTRGAGINRVAIRGVFGRQNLFPFETSFAPSAIDGKQALVLDYDLDVNPGYIRHIHDEIREVSPGLFMGPAMWKRGNDKALVLWFALESRLS